MKILLLDDEDEVLASIERSLVELGHEVHGTNDPKVAVTMVEEGGYDFALVDYRMPVHDGVWFMKMAKVPNTTKVLLMTAFVDREVIDRMFKLGAKGYLIKPIDRDELAFHIDFHSSKIVKNDQAGAT